MQDKNKVVIYQVLPRLFGNLNERLVRNGDMAENGTGKFSAFSALALAKIKELGVTHIWYTGVIEHATKSDFTAYGIRKDHSGVVKGTAGSPYAIKDYYDINPALADSVPDRMQEFEQLIERTHKAGMKVVIDFVPNHVARQYHSDAKNPFIADFGEHDNTSKAFDPRNNFYYVPESTLALHFNHEQEEHFAYSEFPAKATGNDCFSSQPGRNDWYETVKLNYGIDYIHGGARYFDPLPDTWLKMLDILRFWAGKGVDAFRCDMAEMVPVEFWQWVIPQVKQRYSVLFIAEVYNPNEYRNYIHTGQFDYLYDKVGLYDTLRAVVCGQAPAAGITRCWQSLEDIQHCMLNFLENHDEQRIASDFFAGSPLPAIPAMIVAAAMNTNPVMIYCGQELGERGMDEEGFSGMDGRTTIYDYWSMEAVRNWINNHAFDGGKLTGEQQSLRAFYAKLLHLAASEPALSKGLFHDLMYANLSNPAFNTHRQYAFLRQYANEAVLIAVNFDSAEQTVNIRIPANAFSNCNIHDNSLAAVTDLFTGETAVGTLTDAYPYTISLPPYSGKMLKFAY
ncbi:Alpha-amylase 2 [Bacteroidales bacterium Barb4]|nr:Alpha-amylase 2 [Bacteroidales bacterium Barb4]